MSSESAPSVNHIPPVVIHDPDLALPRYATGTVLTNSTPQHVAVVDGSGDQITTFPISGTVTANLSTTDNAVLDAIEAALETAAVDTNHFSATITSADASTATQVKAKTADKKIHVTELAISVGSTAIEVQLQSDNGTPQVVMEENFFAANSGIVRTAADKTLPLFVVDTNEDLDVITSAAGDITVSVSGYVV